MRITFVVKLNQKDRFPWLYPWYRSGNLLCMLCWYGIGDRVVRRPQAYCPTLYDYHVSQLIAVYTAEIDQFANFAHIFTNFTLKALRLQLYNLLPQWYIQHISQAKSPNILMYEIKLRYIGTTLKMITAIYNSLLGISLGFHYACWLETMYMCHYWLWNVQYIFKNCSDTQGHGFYPKFCQHWDKAPLFV